MKPIIRVGVAHHVHAPRGGLPFSDVPSDTGACLQA